MKTNFKQAALAIIMFTVVCMASCDDNNGGDTPPPNPSRAIIIGDCSRDGFEIKNNTTLKAENTYLLKGFVYVPDGITLTIEPGTVIKGDKETEATLIIERGGKIVADGTREKPIVFTSA